MSASGPSGPLVLDVDIFLCPQHIDSGLDKDLDQWVLHPLLFNLMSISLGIKYIKLQKMQSLVKRPNILKNDCLNQMHVAFLENFQDLYNWCILISIFLLRMKDFTT